MITALSAPQWMLHPKRDPLKACALAGALDAPLPVAHALVNRGFDSIEAVQRFLEPTLDDLHDPYLLLDVDRAAARLFRAVESGERILIHGDYDVDGITSTYLLYAALTELGGHVEYRIPHRTRDGYGLSIAAIDEAHRRGCQLVVTVDCGITAVEAVERATALGIDVVITDHHEPPADLPRAHAIVNPHRVGCGYPFKPLAGVGVTFKLVEAMMRDRGGRARASAYLDVVAIGTIADVVPLVGENRVLARFGLERLNAGPRLGLRSLIEVAGLGGKTISSGQIAFVLAPRINAAGRMGNAEQGLRLLLSREESEARDIANSLEEDNLLRRQHDEEALGEAAQMVESELGWPDCSAIVLWSERWHPGVIGIVASRLVERFHRPTVLVALDGDRGRGSGRSLTGLDLNQLLGSCQDLLDSYGGHAFAAGLSVQRGRLPELRERVDRLVRERLSPEDRVPRLLVDDEIPIGDCRLPLVEWLERMSPHGLGNPEPVFMAPGVQVESAQAVGGGKHLRLGVRDASGAAEAIGFGMGDQAMRLFQARRCDLAFVPCRNEFMGETRVQLRVKGWRPL
jgi:single-stranded-DNA-specific exonuclease